MKPQIRLPLRVRPCVIQQKVVKRGYVVYDDFVTLNRLLLQTLEAPTVVPQKELVTLVCSVFVGLYDDFLQSNSNPVKAAFTIANDGRGDFNEQWLSYMTETVLSQLSQQQNWTYYPARVIQCNVPHHYYMCSMTMGFWLDNQTSETIALVVVRESAIGAVLGLESTPLAPWCLQTVTREEATHYHPHYLQACAERLMDRLVYEAAVADATQVCLLVMRDDGTWAHWLVQLEATSTLFVRNRIMSWASLGLVWAHPALAQWPQAVAAELGQRCSSGSLVRPVFVGSPLERARRWCQDWLQTGLQLSSAEAELLCQYSEVLSTKEEKALEHIAQRLLSGLVQVTESTTAHSRWLQGEFQLVLNKG